MKSTGCGKPSPYTPGKSSVVQAVLRETTWTYRIYVPQNYDPWTPLPIIFQCPGWGVDAGLEEYMAGISARADQLRYISVTPQGKKDNGAVGGPWYSWNAVGSTRSPGPAGPTCTTAASNPQYCYQSCKCTDYPQCDWTTCHDGITPTGTGYLNVSGFISTLYDSLEDVLCIDVTREYQAGESNGGMMTYQIGVDMATRVAAIAPQFGSFHRGFNLAPLVGVPVLDLHGFFDTTVPANVSLAADGWYYTVLSEILGGNEFSTGWKTSNACFGPSAHYPTSFDGIFDLYCVSEGFCLGGDVVRCGWSGGHTWFGYSPEFNGGLVTEFLLKWAKPSHVGRGYSAGSIQGPPQLFDAVEILREEPLPSAADKKPHYASSERALTRGPHEHYGDPAGGCLGDEDALHVAAGLICAPRIGSKAPSNRNEPPEPLCKLGLHRELGNGCPPFVQQGHVGPKARPVCLGKDNSTHGYSVGSFHCLLACPCEANAPHCGIEGDLTCPRGASCRRGELRHLAHGVCTFGPSDSLPSAVVI